MAYNVKQITTLLNDVVEDMTAQSAAIQTIDTSNLVSLGKAVSDLNLYDGFFGSLVNRLAKTVYFVRVYDGADNRSILRDEHEYGAFIQKVYYTAPAFVNNPEYEIPSYTGGGAIDEYNQSSPYDVDTTVTVNAMVYGAQGTFALEIVRPVDQIRSAFLSESEMMRFIDGIYVTIENEIKLAEEGLVNAAVSTAIAADINGGKVRNLLTEYNAIASTPITDEKVALADTDFLKYASREIRNTIKYMRKMSTAYNVNGFKTFTDEPIVEVLTDFASAMSTYLEADTFHKELVELPRYTEVPWWQFSGQSNGDFDDVSMISVINEAFVVSVTNPTGEIEDSGIVAFVHDVEHVAAYFGHRRSWEMYNQRDDVYVHGETARKGYAVDLNANGVVFQVKYVAP